MATLSDELPLPPEAQETLAAPEGTFSAAFNSSLLEDVGGLNEPIPAGTKHFRCDKYKKVDEDKDGQPRFDLQWKCQEEPNVGRVLFDFVPWVKQDVLVAAMDPTNIRHQEAKDLIKKRIPRAKDIMKAAEYSPKGDFDFETDFLAMHPEVKIPVQISERKNKDTRETLDNGLKNPDFGKYTIATGTMQNSIPNAYLSVRRP